MKLIGHFLGIPFYEDPNAPPGKLFFLNKTYMKFSPIIDLSPTNLLDNMLKDWDNFLYVHRDYPNKEYLWQRFIRS